MRSTQRSDFVYPPHRSLRKNRFACGSAWASVSKRRTPYPTRMNAWSGGEIVVPATDSRSGLRRVGGAAVGELARSDAAEVAAVASDPSVETRAKEGHTWKVKTSQQWIQPRTCPDHPTESKKPSEYLSLSGNREHRILDVGPCQHRKAYHDCLFIGAVEQPKSTPSVEAL